jgi:hypothetical protein
MPLVLVNDHAPHRRVVRNMGPALGTEIFAKLAEMLALKLMKGNSVRYYLRKKKPLKAFRVESTVYPIHYLLVF